MADFISCKGIIRNHWKDKFECPFRDRCMRFKQYENENEEMRKNNKLKAKFNYLEQDCKSFI